ncbi:SDR family NAD(P)-dependent oxidoreductase [Streptomyces mirabilis]|uniref:SDR family NAD(P)-dependent oxidoreductase n=1 Tax=Streptomyces mirabilis TaxID=68239 RepID=UPI0036DE2916
MLDSLGGQTALVTGAGQGIGRAIAVEMARQGASAVAVADRNAQTAVLTAESVRAAGAKSEVIVCDLRVRDDIGTMVTRATERFDGLDVLVDNAGVIESTVTTDHDRAVDSLSEEVWDAVYEVNLKAAWLTTKFAAPYLRRSPRGPAIVTAVDLAPVRCNCFCPGVIDTPLARGHFAAGEDRDAREREVTAPQLVDRLGRPEEVARLACFLASDSAAFITGAAYVIDGGGLAWRGVKG